MLERTSFLLRFGEHRDNSRKEKYPMAETIIYLVISFLASFVFVILGISQYKSKKPVALNTGEKPPCEDDLTDVSEWNHRHGKNLIIYGCLLFLTMSVFLYCLRKFENTTVQLILFFAVIIGELVWLEVQHNMLKRKLIKR